MSQIEVEAVAPLYAFDESLMKAKELSEEQIAGLVGFALENLPTVAQMLRENANFSLAKALKADVPGDTAVQFFRAIEKIGNSETVISLGEETEALIPQLVLGGLCQENSVQLFTVFRLDNSLGNLIRGQVSESKKSKSPSANLLRDMSQKTKSKALGTLTLDALSKTAVPFVDQVIDTMDIDALPVVTPLVYTPKFVNAYSRSGGTFISKTARLLEAYLTGGKDTGENPAGAQTAAQATGVQVASVRERIGKEATRETVVEPVVLERILDHIQPERLAVLTRLLGHASEQVPPEITADVQEAIRKIGSLLPGYINIQMGYNYPRLSGKLLEWEFCFSHYFEQADANALTSQVRDMLHELQNTKTSKRLKAEPVTSLMVLNLWLGFYLNSLVNPRESVLANPKKIEGAASFGDVVELDRMKAITDTATHDLIMQTVHMLAFLQERSQTDYTAASKFIDGQESVHRLLVGSPDLVNFVMAPQLRHWAVEFSQPDAILRDISATTDSWLSYIGQGLTEKATMEDRRGALVLMNRIDNLLASVPDYPNRQSMEVLENLMDEVAGNTDAKVGQTWSELSGPVRADIQATLRIPLIEFMIQGYGLNETEGNVFFEQVAEILQQAGPDEATEFGLWLLRFMNEIKDNPYGYDGLNGIIRCSDSAEKKYLFLQDLRESETPAELLANLISDLVMQKLNSEHLISRVLMEEGIPDGWTGQAVVQPAEQVAE